MMTPSWVLTWLALSLAAEGRRRVVIVEVTDQHGHPVEGAVVTGSDLESNEIGPWTTDGQGHATGFIRTGGDVITVQAAAPAYADSGTSAVPLEDNKYQTRFALTPLWVPEGQPFVRRILATFRLPSQCAMQVAKLGPSMGWYWR